MIRMFQGRDRHQYAREANEMFRLRARQFRDRLGWKVNVKNGWEIDEYDEMTGFPRPLTTCSGRSDLVEAPDVVIGSPSCC